MCATKPNEEGKYRKSTICELEDVDVPELAKEKRSHEEIQSLESNPDNLTSLCRSNTINMYRDLESGQNKVKLFISQTPHDS